MDPSPIETYRSTANDGYPLPTLNRTESGRCSLFAFPVRVPSQHRSIGQYPPSRSERVISSQFLAFSRKQSKVPALANQGLGAKKQIPRCARDDKTGGRRVRQPFERGGAAIQVVSDADIRIPRLADGAHRCKYCFITADAVCVSKRVVAAAAGLLLRHRPPAERNGPHAGHRLWAHRLFYSHFATGAGVLFFAVASCWIDLPFYAIARVGQGVDRSDWDRIFDQQLKVTDCFAGRNVGRAVATSVFTLRKQGGPAPRELFP